MMFRLICLLLLCFCVVQITAWTLPGMAKSRHDEEKEDFDEYTQEEPEEDDFDCLFANLTYQCSDTKTCISESQLCDHKFDCANGDDEGDHCLKKDPCYMLNCAHHCLVNETDMHCACRDGYFLIGRSHCLDINECLNLDLLNLDHKPRLCSQMCTNLLGGYECTCLDGYELVDGHNCAPLTITPQLYYSIGREIRSLSVSHIGFSVLNTVVPSQHRDWDEITSIVRFENRLFYVGTSKNNHTHSSLNQVLSLYPFAILPHFVYKVTISSFMHETILPFSDEFGRIVDIDVDWIHGNLYLCTESKIVVCNIEPFFCSPILVKLKSVNNIMVMPTYGMLFFTQDSQHGEAGLFIVDLSGNGIKQNYYSGSDYPVDIALDEALMRMYLIESADHSISYVELAYYVTLYGSNSTEHLHVASLPFIASRIMNNSNELAPIVISTFEDVLYWISATNNSIYVSNKFNGNKTEVLIDRPKSGQFGTLSLYHPLKHSNMSYVHSDPCIQNRTLCSHICVPRKADPGYVCLCPSGMYFRNNHTCAHKNSSSSVIVSISDRLIRVYSDSDFVNEKLETHHHSLDEIAYNFDREEVYAHDRFHNQIGAFHITKSSVGIPHWTPLVESRLREVVSLVYDINTDYLYWVDRKQGTFEVTTTRGRKHRTILHDHLEGPLSLALNAKEMKWYIGLEGSSSDKRQIISLDMDGQNRVTILETIYGIPMELAFNPVTRELVWGDPELRHIQYTSTSNMSTPKTLDDYRVDTINSLALSRDSLCWTNADSLNLYCTDPGMKHSNNITKVPYWKLVPIGQSGTDVTRTRVTSGDRQTVLYEVCQGTSHMCEHLCLISPTSRQQYSCVCSDGFVLASNGRSCVGKLQWRIKETREQNEQRESLGKDQLMGRLIRTHGRNNKMIDTWTVVREAESKEHWSNRVWLHLFSQLAIASFVVVVLFTIYKVSNRYHNSITRYFKWSQEEGDTTINQPITGHDDATMRSGIANPGFEFSAAHNHRETNSNNLPRY